MARVMRNDPLMRQTQDTFLGFDFGTKKIGVAVGQLTTATANSLQTLRSPNEAPNWQAIEGLVKEWQPAGFVVGISRQHDGTDNPVTPRMLKFCRQLNGRFNLPVHQQDEMLSTFEAKQLLFDDVHVNATKLWAVQDELAAQLILQTWLNGQERTV
jgi:putative Holliday junction resolvase